MTDNNHPITPPPELVEQWYKEWTARLAISKVIHVATQAARWGADQELEACCEWLHWQNLATHPDLIPSLRAARRPKPPSLKQQALKALDDISIASFEQDAANIIRQALEALPE